MSDISSISIAQEFINKQIPFRSVIVVITLLYTLQCLFS